MKLATLKDGSRDGQLIVVSRDLETAHLADGIAPTLQRALDDWAFVAPQLEDLYLALNHGKPRHAFPFDPRRCMAPLPRAYQWVDGSAYLNDVQLELARRARGADVPADVGSVPLMYQGNSDDFIGPCDDAYFGCEDWGIDFEAELAAVVDDVPMGATPEQCATRIRLLALANDWSLRRLLQDEAGRGFGFLHGKPTTSFAPVAITPDELGDAWRDGRAHLPVLVHWNGRQVCDADAGADMRFSFPELVAHLVRTRNARAGSVIGSGPVSNGDPARGSACIAERRGRELLAHGQATTGYLKFGDRVRIEVLDAQGLSVFGAIDQQVMRAPLSR